LDYSSQQVTGIIEVTLQGDTGLVSAMPVCLTWGWFYLIERLIEA